jgi:putative ABC transport system substrate-binding protein
MILRAVALILVISLLLVAPPAIEAQRPARFYRIGVLAEYPDALDPQLLAGMRRLGYVEGQNLLVERRHARTQDELSVLAAELVQLKVDLIFTRGTRATQTAKQATTTIPIVFNLAADPVQSGLVAGFARPGGNLTGYALSSYEEKMLETLKGAIPGISRVACPCIEYRVPEMSAAARSLGLKFQCIAMQGPPDFDRFFMAARRSGADAVLVHNVAWFVPHITRLAKLTAQHRLPAIGFVREFAEAGGLMSYGPKRGENWGRLAFQVDRILKGTKPADLPVEQPTRFELILNLKTAKALGLTIPPSVLLQADEVIE